MPAATRPRDTGRPRRTGSRLDPPPRERISARSTGVARFASHVAGTASVDQSFSGRCRSNQVRAAVSSATSWSPKRGYGSPRSRAAHHHRSEEHTSELQSLMRISYAVFCLKKKKHKKKNKTLHELKH